MGTSEHYRRLHGVLIDETSDAEFERYIGALEHAADSVRSLRHGRGAAITIDRRAATAFLDVAKPGD